MPPAISRKEDRFQSYRFGYHEVAPALVVPMYTYGIYLYFYIKKEQLAVTESLLAAFAPP